MEQLPTAEIIGIGAVAIGFGTFMWKMWRAHTHLTDRVMSVVQDNATSMERLSQTLGGVAKSVEANTAVTNATKDSFSQLMVAILQTNSSVSPRRKRKTHG